MRSHRKAISKHPEQPNSTNFTRAIAGLLPLGVGWRELKSTKKSAPTVPLSLSLSLALVLFPSAVEYCLCLLVKGTKTWRKKIGCSTASDDGHRSLRLTRRSVLLIFESKLYFSSACCRMTKRKLSFSAQSSFVSERVWWFFFPVLLASVMFFRVHPLPSSFTGRPVCISY